MDWEEDDMEDMEDYYISDNAVDDIDFDGDGDGVDDDDILANREQKNYTVLKEEDIRRRQEDDIAEICAVLSVPRVAACMLLRQYKWSVNSVHEAWFADEDRVRKEVGLVEKGGFKYQDAKELKCGICFEIYSPDEMTSAACGHPYCCACWTTYISISINDGPGCLTLRCPEPSCGAAVNQDMVDVLVGNEDKDKYQRYLLRSYVENNRTTKWCPSPGCDCAVEFDIGSGIQDVSCLCSYSFCWNCIEEAHRPVDCDTVAKWIMRNTAESENTDWIIANSKPCPKCKRPIEKNHGCMHMTCTQPCKFEFCWLCLGAWSDHGEKTGGFYACNRYEAAKQEGAYDESERKRERAKKSLEKYTHYYERWATNHKSRQKALADLHQMRTVHLQKLREEQNIIESELNFVVEAWLQIVECRRVLKWTYAYGFYLAEDEVGKRQFFEYLQGEAEANLERLHQCAEMELQNHYGDDHGTSEDFINFRTKLAHLTRVTHNYFDNLVRELENGLADVDSAGTSSNTINSKADPQRSKGKTKKGKEQLAKALANFTSSDN